jgi:iron complex outermembrane recepter protein
MSRSIKSFILSPLAASLLLSGVHAPDVFAQDALEEVIVTAQRRQQSLQDVPLSIESFSGADIAAQGFRDLGAMSQFTPSLSVSDQQQNSQGISIRGVGTSTNVLAIEQSVAMFLDGIHQGRGANIFGVFMDVDRVEMLRGPQPVYFGQNASAGAISVVSRKPTDEWAGNLSLEAGNNKTYMGEGGFGGPISDTLGIRVAGKYDSSEGYMTDILTLKKFPARESYAGRMVLQWDPMENFEATAMMSYANVQRNGDARTPIACVARDDKKIGSMLSGAFNAVDVRSLAEKYNLCEMNKYGLNNAAPWYKAPLTVRDSIGAPPTFSVDLSRMANELPVGPFAVLEQYNSSLEMNYTFANDILLTSQTAFTKVDRDFARDGQGIGPFLTTGNNRWEMLNQWSQELRLTSPSGGFIEWMVGLFTQDVNLNTGSNSYRASVDGLNVARANIQGNRHGEDDRWYSAFAGLTFNLNEQWSLDLGARYTDVQKDGIVRGIRAYWLDANGNILNGASAHGVTAYAHTPIFYTGQNTDDEFNDKKLNPQIVLRWRPNSEMSTYARYATGMKAGGFDSSVTNVVAEGSFVFDSEEAENWEVGMKGSLLEGTANYSVNAFWTEFTNMQVSAINQDTGLTATTNVASQRVRGLEFDGRYAYSDQLSFGMSGAIMDSEILSYPGASCTEDEVFRHGQGELDACPGRNLPTPRSITDRSGETPPDVPTWAFNLRANYWLPILDEYKATLNVNGMVSDGYKMGFDGIFQMKTHGDMNLTLGFGPQDDVWHVAAFARNILHPRQHYFADFNHSDDTVSTFFSARNFMTYGLTFKYDY